jgi:hypothetical protein
MEEQTVCHVEIRWDYEDFATNLTDLVKGDVRFCLTAGRGKRSKVTAGGLGSLPCKVRGACNHEVAARAGDRDVVAAPA